MKKYLLKKSSMDNKKNEKKQEKKNYFLAKAWVLKDDIISNLFQMVANKYLIKKILQKVR
jgi:hypothetical protein